MEIITRGILLDDSVTSVFITILFCFVISCKRDIANKAVNRSDRAQLRKLENLWDKSPLSVTCQHMCLCCNVLDVLHWEVTYLLSIDCAIGCIFPFLLSISKVYCMNMSPFQKGNSVNTNIYSTENCNRTLNTFSTF